MKSHKSYAPIFFCFLFFQLLVTGLLLYMIVQIQRVHYFNGNGGAFDNNPVPFANVLNVLEIFDVALLVLYIVLIRKYQWPLNKSFLALLLVAFVLGLSMLLYLHEGPLGACMAIPDACGG